MSVAVVSRVALVLAVMGPPTAHAVDTTPLPTYNQSPFAQIFGLPALASPRILERGRVAASLTFDAANHLIFKRRGSEELTLDGETHRTVLAVHYGSANVEWGVEVPYLAHGGGFLDSFIENWHDLFGLRQGGRDRMAHNQFDYHYRRDGADVVQLSGATHGVGDVRLLAGWQLWLNEGSADAAVRVSAKLPTGDATRLHGSGGADLALWLTAGCGSRVCTGAWGWNAAFGVLWLGSGEVLPDMQRRAAVFGGAGVGWEIWPALTLKAEIRAHSPFFGQTEIPFLGVSSGLLILGGTWNLTSKTSVDVGISEDVRVDTTPDVSVLINLRSSF